MTYIPDLKELARPEYYALHDGDNENDFNEWYEKVFLPAIYQELGRELKIFL